VVGEIDGDVQFFRRIVQSDGCIFAVSFGCYLPVGKEQADCSRY